MRDSAGISEYAKELERQFLTGHAREHAYRPALERLMASFDDVTAVNDPKRSQFGNPDFVFLKRSNNSLTFGYAEAKDIDKNLSKTIKSEQLRRYAGYEKLFLTNYLDFKFFRNGEKYEEVSIGHIRNGAIVFDSSAYSRLSALLYDFLNQPPTAIRNGKQLALIMGGKARRIRDNVRLYLDTEGDQRNAELEKIYNMVRQLLVHDLSVDKFADMYAQTLVYGLFAARHNDKTPDDFSRAEARDLIPKSNPFLREFFDHVAGPRFDERLKHIVDELCEVFSVSDVSLLVQKHLRLFEVDNEKDPIIHFYEDFLKEYDPKVRKDMGAYYTPVPVVRFMISEVDRILREDFNLSKGIADTTKFEHTIVDAGGKKYKNQAHRVQILDPAVGTATFLNEVLLFVHKKFSGQQGRWPSYVEQDLLPRLHGFELMMAPYTIAHLKLSLTLQESGIPDFRQRLGVYLTNTLEQGERNQTDIFSYFGLAEAVSEEANQASRIKNDTPIMIVMGNPPYNGVSANTTPFATSLIDKYKVEPGGKQNLQERNYKWINNDYVKFIAFAEEMVAKNNNGIVAMITDNSYLSAPTFRGMRWHLAKTFDKVFVLDLHGNSLNKETCPDGSPDENVFDIMQGVAIIICVKTNAKKVNTLGDVYHDELYGRRQIKFKALLETKMSWEKLDLDPRNLYFMRHDTTGKAEYEEGIRIDELMASSIGMASGADDILVNFNREELLSKLRQSQQIEASNKVTERLSRIDVDPSKIKKIGYRPYDTRYFYYDANVVERIRPKMSVHMANHSNMSLCFTRRIEGSRPFADIFIFDSITQLHSLSLKEGNYFAPLYIYHEDGSRTANFKTEALKQLTKKLSFHYEPEEIMDYIYATLSSTKYRKRYQALLRMDFPRIPVPESDDRFQALSRLGRGLRDLCLDISSSTDSYGTIFPAQGDDSVERAELIEGNVWINDKQYFGNVEPEVWYYKIGSYEPAQRYLKDRVGRPLTNEEIDYYQAMLHALGRTIKQVELIDLEMA